MQVTVAGNLVADPQLNRTGAGQPVAHFRVAHTERRQNGDGTWVDGATTYLAATVWGRQAEHVAATLRRGDRVLVVGRLRQADYQTPEGEQRTGYELVADEVGLALRYTTPDPARAER